MALFLLRRQLHTHRNIWQAQMLMLNDIPDVPGSPRTLSSALTAKAAGGSPCAVSQAMVPNRDVDRFCGFLLIKTKFFPSHIPCPKCYSPMCAIVHFVDLSLHCSQVNLMFKQTINLPHGQLSFEKNVVILPISNIT